MRSRLASRSSLARRGLALVEVVVALLLLVVGALAGAALLAQVARLANRSRVQLAAARSLDDRLAQWRAVPPACPGASPVVDSSAGPVPLHWQLQAVSGSAPVAIASLEAGGPLPASLQAVVPCQP